MNSAPSCQVADILIMAEEYVEGNCGGLDLMSEVFMIWLSCFLLCDEMPFRTQGTVGLME